MNELFNLLGITGLDSIQNIYGGITELFGGLSTTATTTTAATGCNTCTTACRPRACCRRRCCNPCTTAAVASATDVTYDVTVSSYVDVPMKVVNFCPGKTRNCHHRGCGCCCCHHHHGCGKS